MLFHCNHGPGNLEFYDGATAQQPLFTLISSLFHIQRDCASCEIEIGLIFLLSRLLLLFSQIKMTLSDIFGSNNFIFSISTTLACLIVTSKDHGKSGIFVQITIYNHNLQPGTLAGHVHKPLCGLNLVPEKKEKFWSKTLRESKRQGAMIFQQHTAPTLS